MEPIKIPQNLLITSGLSSVFIAKFALFFACILIFTVVFGKICKKFFKIPVIAGQILAGIILGPSFFNLAKWPIFNSILSLKDSLTSQSYEILSSDIFVFLILVISSTFTISFLLWLAGYETDIKDMLKVGPTATIAGFLGAIAPIVITFFAVITLIGGCNYFTAIGLGLVFSATSVSIPVAMLVAQNKMGLRSSKATLGAAIIDDILAVIILSLFLIFIKSGYLGSCSFLESSDLHQSSLSMLLLKIGITFITFFAFGLTVIPVFMKYFNKNRYVTLIAPFAFFFMLIYFSFSEIVGGLAGITGAYFAGLFQRRFDEHHYAENTLSPFISSILVPIFLASIGLQVNLNVLNGADWVIVLLLFIVAVISKFIGVFGATIISNLTVQAKNKWTFFESYLFGASMVARGEVGLVIVTLLRNVGIINENIYVISIVVITLTTLIAPILLSVGFAYESKIKKILPEKPSKLKLGHFDALDTHTVFDAILQILEHHNLFGTVVMLQEGRYVVNLEEKKLEIIYSPKEGIILIGPKDALRSLLQLVKKEFQKDVSKLNIEKELNG